MDQEHTQSISSNVLAVMITHQTQLLTLRKPNEPSIENQENKFADTSHLIQNEVHYQTRCVVELCVCHRARHPTQIALLKRSRMNSIPLDPLHKQPRHTIDNESNARPNPKPTQPQRPIGQPKK